MAGRKRFVAVGNKWVEVGQDFVQEPKNHDSVLWNDREYQDVGDPRFASRTQHREFMKANNLTTYDDFTETFKKEQARRDEFYARAPDPTRPQDIIRAINQLQRRK